MQGAERKAMVFCRGCGRELHETAATCPHCGAAQGATVARRDHAPGASEPGGTLWLPVPALVCGVVAALAMLDDTAWDADTVRGLLFLSGVALVLGISGVATQTRGRGMSIAGIVLGAIGLLGALGASVH